MNKKYKERLKKYNSKDLSTYTAIIIMIGKIYNDDIYVFFEQLYINSEQETLQDIADKLFCSLNKVKRQKNKIEEIIKCIDDIKK